MESFAKRLKQLREEEKLSMRQLAKILGLSPSAYQFYEYGQSEPRLEMLIKIAKHFGVTVGYLLGVEEI